MTKSQNKKPLFKNNDGGQAKGKGPGADSPKDDSGTQLADVHAANEAKGDWSGKAKSKKNKTVGAHISDFEEYDQLTGSQLVQQLLGTYPVDDPFWGDQDYNDDYSVDTEDSAEALGGFHAYNEEDGLNDDVTVLEDCSAYFDAEQFEHEDDIIDAETTRLMALDQQRLADEFRRKLLDSIDYVGSLDTLIKQRPVKIKIIFINLVLKLQ